MERTSILAVALNLCMLLAIAFAFEEPKRAPQHLGIATGVVFAHATLASAWLLIGKSVARPRVRITSLVLSLLFGTASFTGFALRTGAGSTSFVVACAVVVQWLLAAAPFFVMKRQGWSVGLQDTQSQAVDFQFKLSQIMVWTSAVAVLLAAGRGLLPMVQKQSGEFVSVTCFFLLFMAGNTLIAVPMIGFLLSPSRNLVWLALLLLGMPTIGFVEQYALGHIQGMNKLCDPTWLVAIINAAFAVTLVSLLVPLRFQGYRLTNPKAES